MTDLLEPGGGEHLPGADGGLPPADVPAGLGEHRVGLQRTGALVTLELIQARPGITANRLADRLGVSERAARRDVAVLREAGIPVESVRGPYGGYRLGRGVRLPPLVFSNAEALGLVMAVLDGHHAAARPDPTTTALLVQACSEHRRVHLDYRTEAGSTWSAPVDPWAVVVRHGRWYLLCLSHGADAQRAYRIDRIGAASTAEETFEPPAGLDPVGMLEDHLAVGWEYSTEVVVDAPAEQATRWLPRTLGRIEPAGDSWCRLIGSTSNPWWYAEQLAAIPTSYRIIGCPELRDAARTIAERMLAATAEPGDGERPPR